MSEYMTMLREGIRSGNHDVLVDVACVFEKHTGVGENYDLHGQVMALGWGDIVASTDFSADDMALLKSELVQFIRNNPEHPDIGTAIWALGKLCDVTLKPALIDMLREYIVRDAAAMYQAMIALDNLGEKPFGDRQTMSILDEEENRSLAEDYLSRT